MINIYTYSIGFYLYILSMENIEQIVPEEKQNHVENSVTSEYIPVSIDTNKSFVSQETTSDWWLESQLNSPKDFADRVKNLVDNTWPDDFA